MPTFQKFAATDVIRMADPDVFFLLQADALFVGCNLPFKVLWGSDATINAVRNFAHTSDRDAELDPSTHDWLSRYNGVLLVPVQMVCREFADNMARQPMSVTDHLLAHARGVNGPQNRQVRFTNLYTHYLAR